MMVRVMERAVALIVSLDLRMGRRQEENEDIPDLIPRLDLVGSRMMSWYSLFITSSSEGADMNDHDGHFDIRN